MKTSSKNMELWVAANRKKISKEDFQKATGMRFDDFSDTYKSQTRKAWAVYQKTKNDAHTVSETLNLEREAYLLRVIKVWKNRYLGLKNIL